MSEHAAALEQFPFWRRVLRRLWLLLPRSVRRYFASRFSDVSRSEGWGYVVWAAMGLVVGVPEVWAAVAGSDFVWPTISTTVGHLQDRWPVVALVPVALIVMSGYSLFRVGAGTVTLQTESDGHFQALGRTPQGRLARQDVSLAQLASGDAPALGQRREWRVVPYFALATVCVVVSAAAASASANPYFVGYVLYSTIAVFWIAIPNVAAYWFKHDVPFTTLFYTVRCLGRRLQLVAAFIAALLVILLLHLAFYPWPSPP